MANLGRGLTLFTTFGLLSSVLCQAGLTDLGCWKDTPKRAIPTVDPMLEKIHGPYKSRKDAVQICAALAKSRKYTVFAVQDGGWCATGKNAKKAFNKYGPSTACAEDGRGGPWANQVYELAAVSSVSFKYLGCYKDTSDRAIPGVQGRFLEHHDDYKSRQMAIAKCARVAKSLNYKVFAVQDGGWCATGPAAHMTYDKHGPSTACLEDGKGGPWANAVYGIGWEPIPFNDLGCWKDAEKRAIASADKQLEKEFGPYKSRVGAIQMCAQYAKSRGFDVFAVQDGGWCATSKSARDTFKKYGSSAACSSDGEGGGWANQVYEIGKPPTAVKITSIGCYKDTSDRAIPQADGRFSTLRDNYKSREDAITKCASVAKSLGFKVFAIQDGGWCATGEYAHFSYAKHGTSAACGKDGKGGAWANNVYGVDGWEPSKLIPINDLGCWKDTEQRAIASADNQLTKEYGPYKSRVGSVQICAKHAKSLGYTVFAVQDGGWCATSKTAKKTFQKYGASTVCGSDGEGGVWGNQVYEIGQPPSGLKYNSIGCYTDTENRAISQADGRFSTLRDNYKNRQDAIAKCAAVAKSLGFKVFAVQDGGWCATDATAHLSYAKYGPSAACGKDGKGGAWANNVYGVDDWTPDELIQLNDLGCWKDTSSRAIASVDKKLEKKFGPYKNRIGAVQRCAEFAQSHKLTVFAVQDGGWCATSGTAGATFDKYGPSFDCKPNGKGGPWSNQVYEIGKAPKNVAVTAIGCYKDTEKRAIPQADGRYSTLRDNYKARDDAIAKCSRIARLQGNKVFAIQDGGWCATGPNAHLSYSIYGPSNDCKNGKGGPWANDVYGVDGWSPKELIQINDLGCWKDTEKRAIPSADKQVEKKFGPYKSRIGAVQRCAEFAKSRKNTVFAVQDGGWCATSRNAKHTFNKYGPSTKCQPDGEGGTWSNQVYEIGPPPNEVKYSALGCYKDNSKRAVPQADGQFSTLRDNYKSRAKAIEKCASVATSLGYTVFAVQDGGWCATGPSAHFSFSMYGPSVACRPGGKGGPWANNVYSLNNWAPVQINDLGCWKDSEKRAIPSVDLQLEEEYGPYKSRGNAVGICAHYAKSRGHDVFAVQDGGWCATSRSARKTFRKYGPSTACKPDGKGGAWGNQVYEIGAPPSRVKFAHIGCYKDTGDRAVPQADQYFSTLRDNYKARKNAITKCAAVAASLGYKVFAIQDGGWCATGPNAHLSFDKYGPSSACHGEGKGGRWANDVFGIDGWKKIEVNDLGCWKDAPKRAISSADKILEKHFGPYKSREGAVQLCAEHAKSRGYRLFAVQDGGWCATSKKAQKTFDKYGSSLSCEADGRGGPWANQVYEVGRAPSAVKYNFIGCYLDKPERAIPQADQRFSLLRGPYKSREDAIQKCALVAASLGYKVFAVQDGGWCATGPEAHTTYDTYGASTACVKGGKGGPWANAVYGLDNFGTDYCKASPCPRGECVSQKNSFKCICPSTHSGPLCDEEINFCESAPCVNGECVMHTGGFECVCYKGFRGEICSQVIDYCTPNPCGEGVCVPVPGREFLCGCPPGKAGKFCEQVNVCSPNPCLHGKCDRKGDGYICTCDPGYSGKICDEENKDPCKSSPCKNGGTCASADSQYWCSCAVGYKGERCGEKDVWDVYSPCTRTCGGGSRYKVTKCDEDDITKCRRVYESCNLLPCLPNPACTRLGYEYKYKSHSECCEQSDPKQVCGVSAFRSVSRRVIGGYLADLGKWPWAALLHIKSSVITNATCGGSLIHSRWILSAAHCLEDVDANDVTVYLGTTNPTHNHLSTQVIKAEKIIIHEAFSFPVSDVALIKLAQHASLTQLVRPICLPMGERVGLDVNCFVVGWGVAKVENIARGIPSDDLMEVSLKNLDYEVCRSGYHGTSVYKYLNQKMLCAGQIEGGVDTCIGDSGGPLMCQRCESCSWFLAGVTSFGSSYCGTAGRPGIYTNVLMYEDWIKKYVSLKHSEVHSCA